MTAKIIDFAAYKLARDVRTATAILDNEPVPEREYTDIPMADLTEEELRSFFDQLQSCFRD